MLELEGLSSQVCTSNNPCSALAGQRMTEYYPVLSHVIRLAFFTLIRLQRPHSLTFPSPISTITYFSHDLNGNSKSARGCKSILEPRAHSSILQYLGHLTMLEHLGGLDSAQFEPAHIQHLLEVVTIIRIPLPYVEFVGNRLRNVCNTSVEK